MSATIDEQTTVSSAAAAAAPAASPAASTYPKRLLIATINRAHGQTGVHTHTRSLASGLRSAKVECTVISAFDAGWMWWGVFAARPLLLHPLNQDWSTLWHRRWHLAALRRALARRLARATPDAVIAQCPVSAAAAMQARDDARGSFPVAMVCHFNRSEADEYRAKGELNGEDRYRAMMDFEDDVLRRVDRVIYVSNWARRCVEESRHITPRASSVIWNGIEDLDAGKHRGDPLSRADLGLGRDDLVLINVGSLEPRKNQLGLLDSFAAIRREYASAKMLLIGDGPDRGRIERRIGELKLSGAVVLAGRRADVPAILPLADLYVHAAEVENCPLALIEAARASLPLAAVAAGGVPELQDALDCRFEIDLQNIAGSIDSIRPLLNSPEARKQSGARARANFEQRFSLDAMTRQYLGVLAKET